MDSRVEALAWALYATKLEPIEGLDEDWAACVGRKAALTNRAMLILSALSSAGYKLEKEDG